VLVALMPSVIALAACSESPRGPQDSAACPGDTCASDAQEHVDAIGSLAGVTDVVAVTREYGFDRGSHRTAEVRTDASTAPDVRQVALTVMAALEDWPEHADGGATVVVEPVDGPPVTFVLDDDWVCRQPEGKRVACTSANSWTLDGERVSQ
jgi:hypothetical protein